MDALSSFRSAFAARLRRRRASLGMEGARRGGRRALAAAFAVLLLCALGILPAPPGPFLAVALLVLLLLGGAALGAFASLRTGGAAEAFAREMDRALEGGDLVATARSVALRRAPPGRFAEAVADRAAEAVAALPEERLGPLPRPPWRLLGLAALVALLLALLPQGGLGILPGLGSGWGTGGRPKAGSLNWGEAGEKEGGKPKPVPEAPPVASLEVKPLARTHRSFGPIPALVRATGLEGAGEGTDLELFVSVDGGEAVGEGRPRRIVAGARDSRAVDLRSRFPALLPALGPGTHKASAELRDGTGRAVAKAEEFEIRVEGEGEGEGRGKGGEQGMSGAPEPEQAAPESPPPDRGSKPKPPPPETPLPPSTLERKVVLPLFGEGPEAVKKGPLLVLDPEGGRGAPPREMPPEEALAEVRARAEEAARREGVDPRDVRTVRLYFEALRRIVEGGR